MSVLKSKVSRASSLGFAAAAAGAVGLFIAFAAPASAQADNEVWVNGGCPSCHGANAEGGEPGKMPPGPRLRRTRLSLEEVIETVSCGRAGTGMPSHLATAYTETPCYGAALGPRPAGLPKGVNLTPEEIAAIAAWVKAL